jgi:dCTP diphosphatase
MSETLSSDAVTTVATLRDMVAKFVADRQWQPHHAPKNLAMSLAIEAAELMEHFQWIDVPASRLVSDDPKKLAEVSDELADVVCYALALANVLDLDLSAALASKMKKNEAKYPVEKYQGNYEKPKGPT